VNLPGVELLRRRQTVDVQFRDRYPRQFGPFGGAQVALNVPPVRRYSRGLVCQPDARVLIGKVQGARRLCWCYTAAAARTYRFGQQARLRVFSGTVRPFYCNEAEIHRCSHSRTLLTVA